VRHPSLGHLGTERDQAANQLDLAVGNLANWHGVAELGPALSFLSPCPELPGNAPNR